MAVPRNLLLAVRGELRAWSGHWAHGFTSGGEPLVKHDAGMADGSCLSCALLAELDALLYLPEPEPEPEGTALVVDLVTARRRRDVPLGWGT